MQRNLLLPTSDFKPQTSNLILFDYSSSFVDTTSTTIYFTNSFGEHIDTFIENIPHVVLGVYQGGSPSKGGSPW